MITLDAKNPTPLVEQFASQRMEDHKTHSRDGIVLYAAPEINGYSLTFKPVLPEKFLAPDDQKRDDWDSNLVTFAAMTMSSQANQGMMVAMGSGFAIMQNIYHALGPKGLQFDATTIEVFASKVDDAVSTELAASEDDADDFSDLDDDTVALTPHGRYTQRDYLFSNHVDPEQAAAEAEPVTVMSEDYFGEAPLDPTLVAGLGLDHDADIHNLEASATIENRRVLKEFYGEARFAELFPAAKTAS